MIVDIVMPESMADLLWFQSWDVVSKINDTPINAWNIWVVLKDNIGKEINIDYTRNNKSFSAIWVCPEDSCILGISFIVSWSLDIQNIKYPIHKAAWFWLKEIWAQVNLTFSALWNLWKNLLSFDSSKIKWSLSWLTWPVWVIKFWDNLLISWGRVLYLAFAGLISLALAIFNILPIPALDGGRILWTLIQKIWRLKAEKYFVIEGYINTVFFILLMILWVYIIFKDLVVFRWVNIPFIG